MKTTESWDREKYGDRPFNSGYTYKGLHWFDLDPEARPKMCYFAVYFNKKLLIEWYSDKNFNGIYRKTEQGFELYSLQTVFYKRSDSRDEFTNSPQNKKKTIDPWHYERCCMYEVALAQRKYNNDPKTGADFWASKHPIMFNGKQVIIGVEASSVEVSRKEIPSTEREYNNRAVETVRVRRREQQEQTKDVYELDVSEYGGGTCEKTNELLQSSEKNKANIERANAIEKEIDSLHIEGKEKEALVKIRVNQDEFRNRLLKKYHKCCLCGVTTPNLLFASHIKPWSVSEPAEKLDENNGLLLCPNHDKLFDGGYITFNDDGGIIISDELDVSDRLFMYVRDDMRIEVNNETVNYLKYHRKYVFKGK